MKGAAFEPGPLEGDIAAILGIDAARPAYRRRGMGVRVLVPAALSILSASFVATALLRSPDTPVRSGGGAGGEAKTMAAADRVSGSPPADPAAGAPVPQGRSPIDPPPRARQMAALEPTRKGVSPRQPDRRDIPRRSDDDVPAMPQAVAPPAGRAGASPDRRRETRSVGPATPAETRTASLPVEAVAPAVGSGDAPSAGRQDGASAGAVARSDLALAGAPDAPAAAAAPDPPGTSEPRSGSKVRVQRSIDAIRLLRRQ